MINLKSRRAKITSVLGASALIIGIIFFLLRGPYLSNYIKRLIIPVLENVTRERIIIDKAVINLFPFYVQTKGFKLFDKDGNRLLWITKTRVYIDLLGLLSKEIRVRKLTLLNPDLTANERDLRRIIGNIKKSSSVGQEGTFTVSLKNIKLTEGNLRYFNEDETAGISGDGFVMEMVSRRSASKINFSLDKGVLTLPNNSDLTGGFECMLRVDNDKVEISSIKVHSSKSTLNAEGELTLAPDGKVKEGTITGKTEIYAETINRIFNLEQEKEGVLVFDGTVNMAENRKSKWPGFSFNLKTDSRFYLESLMEIVKVKSNIKGQVSINGKITGTFPDVMGKGIAKLDDGVFDTLPIDDVTGEIAYKDRKFSLNDFTASVYNGRMEGDADIMIPHGDYTVSAGVSDISSPEFFRFIRWEPPFPAGKISGHFLLSHEHGQDKEVIADVNYLNTNEAGDDLLSRLKKISTSLELSEGILHLENTVLSTSMSDLFLEGGIDLKKHTLALDLQLESRDVSDFTMPRYSRFIAPVKFRGKASGPVKAPVISGRLEADTGSIHGIRFVNAFADLDYKISSLNITKLRVNQENASYDVSGSIDFRKASGLFSFKDPYYRGDAVVSNADIRPFLKASYKEIPVSGFAGGTLSFEGDYKKFTGSGDLVVENGTVYEQKIDRIAVKASLHPDRLEFHSVSAKRLGSDLSASGTLFFNRQFSVSAVSDRFQVCDFPIFDKEIFDGLLSFAIEGDGTFSNPDIRFSSDIIENTFKGAQMGKGHVEGRLKGKNLTVHGSLVDGALEANAEADLLDETLWNADLNFKRGNYNFLLTGFLKESPRDLSISMTGNVRLNGKGSDTSIRSRFDSMNLSLYGYNLRNREDIVVELDNEEIHIKSFSLTGSKAELSAGGTLNIKKDLKLKMKGNLDIAPLMSLSDKLASLRGKGDFTVGINGAWENPEVVGEIHINDATTSLKDFPYKFGPINGTLYLKKDRIVFESFDTKFAGGDVVLSGAGYFEKLKYKRLFISSDISGIKVRPMEGVSATIDGKLFYENSLKGASLTGDIDIKKARYNKRFEWKSWLLGFKEIKEGPVEYPKIIADTKVHIRLKGAEDIIIDNNIARTPVNISLNITGIASELGMVGRIEAEGGSVYFRSNEFKILKGSHVDFINPNSIVPDFHILAETYTGDYHVRLSLDGNMDKFTLSLFSEPPLAESDILSLLTFGQVGKGVKGIEGGIAAGEATALLTGTLQDTVEEELKNYTGFERIEIEPHTTTEGSFTPKVTVGKRLLEDKIYVTYSSALGTAEEQVIEVEYKLDENMSLVGSRNEIGSAGVDIKYRFEFK